MAEFQIMSTSEQPKPASTQRRTRRNSVSAEVYRPDANFKAPIFEHSPADLRGLENATRNNILFKSLASNQRRKIYNAMKRVEVSNGNVIIKEGASGDFFYVVLQGTFHALKKQCGDQPVAKYNSGGSFGELALMYNVPRAATVVAKSRGVLFKMDRHSFKQMVVGSNAGADYVGQLRSKFDRQSLSMHQAEATNFRASAVGERPESNVNAMPRRPSRNPNSSHRSPNNGRSLTSREDDSDDGYGQPRAQAQSQQQAQSQTSRATVGQQQWQRQKPQRCIYIYIFPQNTVEASTCKFA
jgi:CRP-like cAMP-binding protein